jgi:hypothetical protein
LLCTEDVEETGNDSLSILYLGPEDAPASGSCPMMEAPKATLRDRHTLIITDAVVAAHAPFINGSGKVALRLLDSYNHSPTDPPFERLQALRI